ncbi:HAD hydrolase-like protein [Ruminococcus sp.]|uniref:HAD hydrolase-like protein n=1 Tax=Ruminococcus sp. TaxID=41978 RepID=UPI0034A096DE
MSVFCLQALSQICFRLIFQVRQIQTDCTLAEISSVTNKLLAIFDLDGTLYDTKEVNYRSYKEALSQIKLS